MGSVLKRAAWGLGIAACATLLPAPRVMGAPSCESGNGGITLPTGFCAQVVADNLGQARHMAVAANGDLYVAIQGAGPLGETPKGGGAIALRDANNDGTFEIKEVVSAKDTTGIAIRNGYLYLAHPTVIELFKLTAGTLKPTGAAETIVSGLPDDNQHADKGLAFDSKGSLYINVGAPSNACQNPDRRPAVKGQDPCPILEKHGGIWKFDENKAGQTQATGTRFATGLRQMPAITWHDNALYVMMHNRDQLDTFWPDKFTAKENAERPAEAMFRAVQGSNFGWPYCFYDYGQKKFLLNPEYGGDGKAVGRCTEFTAPVAAYPAHWAPVDIIFYSGAQFPKKYQGGAFIAFH
jgi:glucose/arabinose dehydrogenase